MKSRNVIFLFYSMQLIHVSIGICIATCICGYPESIYVLYHDRCFICTASLSLTELDINAPKNKVNWMILVIMHILKKDKTVVLRVKSKYIFVNGCSWSMAIVFFILPYAFLGHKCIWWLIKIYIIQQIKKGLMQLPVYELANQWSCSTCDDKYWNSSSICIIEYINVY